MTNLLPHASFATHRDNITMQPRFSRTTWLGEVNKMKAVYGAHISDDAGAENYGLPVFYQRKT